ncbi:MAG: hypothetical protein LAO55_00625 [Acidobacteriia bacterium]|nr:hypothetical protein [Terriglobia bacterium]
MSVLAVTSITNILLASLVFFLAGRMSRIPKARFSAAWYFTGVLLLLGVAALIGAVDHGFFESAQLPRYFIQRADWIALGGVTFCLLLTTAKQFFAPRFQRILLIAAVIQFAADSAAVLLVDSFLDVILNYAPVMLLLLGMSIKARSIHLTAGLLILSVASAIQVMGWDALSPLDRNGVYHVVSMLGVVFLYFGGVTLKTK